MINVSIVSIVTLPNWMAVLASSLIDPGEMLNSFVIPLMFVLSGGSWCSLDFGGLRKIVELTTCVGLKYCKLCLL
jgi:hypothetical protein